MKSTSNFGKFYIRKWGYDTQVQLIVRFINTAKYFRVYPYGVFGEFSTPYVGKEYTEVTADFAKRHWNKVFSSGDKCFHFGYAEPIKNLVII